MFPSTTQEETALVVEQRKIRVLLNLSHLLLLNRFEHELSIVLGIVLQKYLIDSLVIHKFVVSREREVLSAV